MIVKNFLPQRYHEEILRITSSNKFPWYYVESISGQEINNFKNFSEIQYGFEHILYETGPLGKGVNSSFYDFFSPIVYFIEEKTEVKVNKLERIRLGLYTKIIDKEGVIHLPHVDSYEPHKAFLYYVNDSDGDTIMYDQTFVNDQLSNLQNNNQKSFSIKERITPEANKAILFDGLRYHSSSSPTKNIKRIVISVNFT